MSEEAVAMNELMLTLNRSNCLKDTAQWFYNQVNNVCDGSVHYYPWSIGQYALTTFLAIVIAMFLFLFWALLYFGPYTAIRAKANIRARGKQ